MVTKKKSIIQNKEEELNVLNARAGDLSPQDRLQFAKWVLRGIACFFILSILMCLYEESYGKALFDTCKTGLLPIASFVIGGYFGSKK